MAQRICLELTVHSLLEHEIFYPALQAAISAAEVLAQAEVEHSCITHLVTLIESKARVDTSFDAAVKTLSVYVARHIAEERALLFVLARNSRRLDLVALRKTLQKRKDSLMQEAQARIHAQTQALAARRAAERATAAQKKRELESAARMRRGAPASYAIALRMPR